MVDGHRDVGDKPINADTGCGCVRGCADTCVQIHISIQGGNTYAGGSTVCVGSIMYNSPRHNTSFWKSHVVRLGFVNPDSSGVQVNVVVTSVYVGCMVCRPKIGDVPPIHPPRLPTCIATTAPQRLPCDPTNAYYDC